jgi:hypothetical protein
MNTAHVLTWLCFSTLAYACEQVTPDISWERMIDQQRGKAFRPSPYFADGKLMQAPPEGTVPASRPLLAQPVREGLEGNSYVNRIPLTVTHTMLDRGRNRFEIFCATCHGIDGSGESIVGHNMELRAPPSLVADRVPTLPVGEVFQAISEGYGLMPSYASELTVNDRWAVVAYVRALQRSQGVPLASLPDSVRSRAQEALP